MRAKSLSGWAIVTNFAYGRLTLRSRAKFCKLSTFERTCSRNVNQPATHSADVPGVWVLTGHKAGDNAQVIALAEALGKAFDVSRIQGSASADEAAEVGRL